jgi:hypothetical protein
MPEFQGFTKIARLFRPCVITEKIDGTNGAIGITEFPFGFHVGGIEDTPVGPIDHDVPGNALLVMGPNNTRDWGHPETEYLVYAQSRNRIITPKADNHGFAAWVWANAEALVDVLGPGLHFGEWWGSGINRGYGLPSGEHRFSLFNTSRWTREYLGTKRAPMTLDVVPVLYEGAFSSLAVVGTKQRLLLHGSYASPGFMNPEGVVVYHAAGNVMFKSTLKDDEVPKAVAKRKPYAEWVNLAPHCRELIPEYELAA